MKKNIEPKVSKNLEKIQEIAAKAKEMISRDDSKIEIIKKIETASNITKLLKKKILGTYIKICFKDLNKARKDKEIMQITKELLVINNKLNH